MREAEIHHIKIRTTAEKLKYPNVENIDKAIEIVLTSDDDLTESIYRHLLEKATLLGIPVDTDAIEERLIRGRLAPDRSKPPGIGRRCEARGRQPAKRTEQSDRRVDRAHWRAHRPGCCLPWVTGEEAP